MEKLSGIGKICLRIAVVILTVIYPAFMAMMSAAGWMHNVGTGAYPAMFRSLAGFMFTGGGLVCAGTISAMLGIRARWWKCNIAGIASGCVGCGMCLAVLRRFCTYADEHFSGIGDDLMPVSQLYRDRLLPILLVTVLLTVLCLWQIFTDPAREFRIRKRREQAERENAPAPKILGD